MQQVKVVQFLPYFPPHKGGLETVAEEFSKYFISEKCWEVLNITFSVGQKSLQSYEQDGYKVLILPAFDIIHNYPFPKFWTPQFRSVLKQVKKRNPEVIQTHTRFFLSTFLWGLCAKLWKKKWVHVEHGSGLVKGLVRWKSWISNAYDYTLGKLCFNGADQIVAISKWNIPFIKKFSKTPIEVIYRGLDFPEMRRKEKKTDQVSFGFVGRLVKLKGVDLLISAFADLVVENSHLTLQIIGDGEERNSLEKQVKNLGLERKVQFLGFQDKEEIQQRLLPSRDIFVNPSLQEGLPTTVIEALFAQCITVATDVGGTREIADGEDFIVVEPWNVEALKRGLNQALALVWKAHWASSQQLRERFNWMRGVREYLEIYRKLY